VVGISHHIRRCSSLHTNNNQPASGHNATVALLSRRLFRKGKMNICKRIFIDYVEQEANTIQVCLCGVRLCMVSSSPLACRAVVVVPPSAYFLLLDWLHHKVSKKSILKEGCVDIGSHKEGTSNHGNTTHACLVE